MIATGVASCTKDPSIPMGVVFTNGDSGDGGSGGGLGSNDSSSYNGHDYVDLDLPSGTLWATCNVGASSPEDYGDYFAWGETTTKSSYDWSTYKYCNGSYNTLVKYCNNSSYGNNGFTDGLTVLQTCDDAATVNWGSGWCMPTKVQWEELSNNTTMTWTTLNGVKGSKFVASNGSSLFLPATGYRNGNSLNFAGSSGGGLSSSLDTGNPEYAFGIYFSSGGCDVGSSGRRCCGWFVRAVRSSSQN